MALKISNSMEVPYNKKVEIMVDLIQINLEDELVHNRIWDPVSNLVELAD